jgi:uncharacterized delta-60 repeat protein
MRKHVFVHVRRVYPMLLALTGLLVAASAGAAPTTLASGALDSGFGKGGRIITTVGMPASGARAVLIQPDGKIVAAGYPGNIRGFALVRYARNGSLDPTFGSHGRVTTRLVSDPRASGGLAWALARQYNGKIIAAGEGYGTIALARYGRTGRLDRGFGTGGIVQTEFSDSESESAGAYDVVLQPDGKIVAVGRHDSSGHEAFALVRYRTNGTLDPSFGTGGKVTTATGGFASAVAVQPDGKIVVAGSSESQSRAFTVARYEKDGSLDPTFGVGGIVETRLGSTDGAQAVIVQRGGKIVVVGSTGLRRSSFTLVRYNRNGTRDSSFGSRGIVKAGFGLGSSAVATAAARQRDGRIVVVGWFFRYPRWEFAVARFGANGHLDRSFGTGGRITTSFRSVAPKTSRGRQDTAHAVAIQPNGKIVVAGDGAVDQVFSRAPTKYKFELARYVGH